MGDGHNPSTAEGVAASLRIAVDYARHLGLLDEATVTIGAATLTVPLEDGRPALPEEWGWDDFRSGCAARSGKSVDDRVVCREGKFDARLEVPDKDSLSVVMDGWAATVPHAVVLACIVDAAMAGEGS